MECAGMKNYHGPCNRRNKLPILNMDSGYTGNRYPICNSLLGDL